MYLVIMSIPKTMQLSMVLGATSLQLRGFCWATSKQPQIKNETISRTHSRQPLIINVCVYACVVLCTLVLHYRDTVHKSYSDSWRIKRAESETNNATDSSKPGAGEPPNKKAKGLQEGQVGGGNVTVGGRQVGGVHGTVGGQADAGAAGLGKGGGSTEDFEKKQKKADTVLIAKLVALKKSHDTAIAGAYELLGNVDHADEWKWAQLANLGAPARLKLDEIKNLKTKNDMWKAWSMETNFTTVARSSYMAMIRTPDSANDMNALQSLVDGLNAHIQMVKKMHAEIVKNTHK